MMFLAYIMLYQEYKVNYLLYNQALCIRRTQRVFMHNYMSITWYEGTFSKRMIKITKIFSIWRTNLLYGVQYC